MSDRHLGPAFPSMLHADHQPPQHFMSGYSIGQMMGSSSSSAGASASSSLVQSSSQTLNQAAFQAVTSSLSLPTPGSSHSFLGESQSPPLPPPILGQNVTIEERGGNFMRVSIEGRKDKPFVCIFQRSCFKVFKRRSDLTVHMRYHTGEKPFPCSFGCGSAFAQSSTLKVHERKHTGEKPFCCPYPNCKQRTTTKSDLRKHIRVHTGEKPFMCTFAGCGMRFTERGSLRVHWKRHQQSPVGPDSLTVMGIETGTANRNKKKTKGKKKRVQVPQDNGWVTAIRQAVGVTDQAHVAKQHL